jgi:tetratricopeptide (TPR) repeat protein
MKYHQCLQPNRSICGYILIFLVLLFAGSAISQSGYLKIAQSLERQHEYQQALVVYQQIYNTNKNDLNVLRGIKNCYQGLQQYDQLIVFLKNAQQQTPQNLYISSYLAEAYFQMNERAQAKSIWQNHLQTHKKDIAVYRIVASSMISMRLFDEAIEVYELAMLNITKQYNLHMEIANLYKLQLKYGEAADHLLQYYVHSPKQFNYIQREILNLADEQEQLPNIIQTIERFEIEHPQISGIKEIQANLYIKEKNFELAFKIYQQLDTEKTQGNQLIKFANAAKSNNAVEYTLKAYQVILARYPQSRFAQNASTQIAQAHKLLAYQKKDASRFAEAGAEIQKAVVIYDSLIANSTNAGLKIESHNQLGEIYAQFYFDLDKAIQHYKKYVDQQRNVLLRDAALIKLGDIYLKKNLLTDADKTYAQVNGKEFRPIASFKQTEILYYSGHMQAALEQISNLQKSVSLQNILYNDILEKKQLLESFAQDSISLQYFASAELLIFQQKKSEAAKVLSDLAFANKKISTLAGRGCGKLYLELDKPEEAGEVLQYLRSEYPEDVHADEILFYLAQSREFLGEYKQALDLYSEIITKHRTSLYLSEARQKARLIKEQLKKDEI